MAATVSHIGYGTLVGALFTGIAQGRLLPKCPVSEGVLFGGAVWAALQPTPGVHLRSFTDSGAEPD